MSLYGLSFTAGVALGPAVGGTLLATSPDAVWWGGTLTLALTAAGFLRLGHRVPDPLLQTKSQPLQAAPEPTCPASPTMPAPSTCRSRVVTSPSDATTASSRSPKA